MLGALAIERADKNVFYTTGLNVFLYTRLDHYYKTKHASLQKRKKSYYMSHSS